MFHLNSVTCFKNLGDKTYGLTNVTDGINDYAMHSPVCIAHLTKIMVVSIYKDLYSVYHYTNRWSI